MRSHRDPLRSSHLRKVYLHRLADHLERLAGAFARLAASLAKSVPDDRRIAIDLDAPRADVTQLLDHDLSQQLLVVHASDLRRPAFMIHAIDRGLIRKQFMELKKIADVG